MRISILTPDMSHNCLGRAYLLAKVLQRRYEVEIVGPAFQRKVWEPLAGQDEVELRVVRGYPAFYRCMSQMRATRNSITGDVLYASKPLLSSFGAALLEKLSRKRPLVLDIDDWQMGFQKEVFGELPAVRKLTRLASSALYFGSPRSYWNSLFGEQLTRIADEVTVASSFLKHRFGGTVIWHARDTNAWDPRKFDRHRLRDEFGIPPDRNVVVFFGTPRPYKGIDDLVDAIALLDDDRILLVLVGLDDDRYSRRVDTLVGDKLGDRRARLFEPQPFEKVPEFLIMSDLVVIPQRRNLATIGQVPAKVFDAMAMARPIIATRVSDLPEILDGCGWIVEPGSPDQLAETIQHVLGHPDEAEPMGGNARDRCVERYSWDAVGTTLVGIFRKYE